MTLGGKQNVFDLQFASQNVENVTTVYKNKIKIDENVFQQETSCKLFDRNSVWHKM